MVVQVGDKVLVYGAGTPWSFAKQITTPEVGDKVDVVTLSDGTKLAMPKIEIDLSDYVWVVPEFDTPFNIGDVPFQWGMMPLGAAVFTITGLTCETITDIYRAWVVGQLAGMILIMISGARRKQQFRIASNTQNSYKVIGVDDGPVTIDDWGVYDAGHCNIISEDLTGGLINVVFGYRSLSTSRDWIYWFPNPIASNFPENNPSCVVDRIVIPYVLSGSVAITFNVGWKISSTGWWHYKAPQYGVFSYSGEWVIDVGPEIVKDYSDLHVIIHVYIGAPSSGSVLIGPVQFRPPDCQTEDIKVGDQYILYNPETGKLIFNDGNKPILSSAYWRAITSPGEEISTSAVEYLWDGQGRVYLSQSSTIQSTIFYDNELKVTVTSAAGVKEIAYHSADPFTSSGETVSRELVNITSLLRAGKNSIVLTVRDTTGTKVGFPTPVYILRSIT